VTVPAVNQAADTQQQQQQQQQQQAHNIINHDRPTNQSRNLEHTNHDKGRPTDRQEEMKGESILLL
jgi:hypothetical protein